MAVTYYEPPKDVVEEQERKCAKELKRYGTPIREYYEKYPVFVKYRGGVPVLHATNEGGFNGVCINLRDVAKWIKEHKPELLK